MGDGRQRQGIVRHGQRFGPYSFVVNTDKVSRDAAEDQGWDLWNDPKNDKNTASSSPTTGTYSASAVLPNFDPVQGPQRRRRWQKFTETAKRVFKGAKVVGDIATMNQSLVSGEIDFHLTGGTFPASPAASMVPLTSAASPEGSDG